MPPLLHGAWLRQAAAVRGVSGLLRRGAPVLGGRSRVRVHAGLVPGHVPPLSSGAPARVLRVAQVRAPLTAEEVCRTRGDLRAAQAQPLGVRDQRGAQGARSGSEPDGGSGGAQGGRVRAVTTPPRRGAAKRSGPTVEPTADARQLSLTPR